MATAYTSKANGIWSAGGLTTWNQVGHPQGGDTALISNDVTVTASASVGDGSDGAVTIASGATLILADNVTLTINGNIDNSGSIDMGDGAAIEFGPAPPPPGSGGIEMHVRLGEYGSGMNLRIGGI